MIVLATARLVLRRLTVQDAAFILGLVNEPSWLRFIGDRGIRTLADAREYIRLGPVASYEHFGFGLYLVQLADSGEPIGLCGLLRREMLDDVDLGFAFLPQHWSKGYAVESAAAVLQHGRQAFGLRRIVAVTDPDNRASIRVLEKLGMRGERKLKLSATGPELELFAVPV